MKTFGFLGTVVAFTLYGYGTAQQIFVREKIKIVEQHSIRVTNK